MNMTLSQSIQKALALTSTLLLLPGLVQADTTPQSIHSTGSHLKTEQSKPSSTLMVYTREDILRSGESNAADFIRNLPSNSFGSFRPQSGSTVQGDATVSLRGLGADKTLVLIDGRRLPKSPQYPAWQNLNLIPLGAVERIEVMTEGASAIYGSDAVGGVVNVITRNDFQGAEIMLGTADASLPKNGGEREEGSVVFGAQSDRSSLLAGVSWNDREIIYQRDLPWRESTSSAFGNSFTTITNGFDNFNWTSYIAGCESLGAGFNNLSSSSSLNGSRCDYDTSNEAADEASLENKSFYAKASHQINDQWSLWANTSFNQSESFGRYAPVPDSSYFSTPLSANSLNNPTNPNSPLYDASLGLSPQAVNWWHRFAALGNRDTTVTNQLLDFTFGTTGQIGQAALNVGLRHSDNRAAEVGRNYLLRSAAQALIEDGSYNLANPYNSPEQVLNAMKITLFRDAKYDQDELFATLNFDLFELNGGKASVVTGAEYRQEKYLDQYDPQSEAGQVGGTLGRSAAGERDVKAVYVEAGLPVLEQLHFNLAARYDDYSDMGSETSSKLTAQWQPLENLTIRGSFSQDHSAANLKILNQTPENPVVSIPTFVNTEIRLNPLLKSEQIDQFNLDVNYKVSDWLDLNIGYWDVSLSDRIKVFSSPSLIFLLDNNRNLPAGLSCTPDGQGGFESCIGGYGNMGTVNQSGLTFKAQTNIEIWGGRWNSQLHVVHQLELNVENGRDLINGSRRPASRALLSNSYENGNWGVAYNINHISSQDKDSVPYPVGSWTTHDVQASYHAAWDGTFTLGVKNAGEKLPPVGQGNLSERAYDFNLYDGFGRIVYARYTQTF